MYVDAGHPFPGVPGQGVDQGPGTGAIRPWCNGIHRRTLQVMQDMPSVQLLQGEVPAVATRMLTAKEVEGRLGVDASTVYRMAADGRLPGVRVGRQWRFPPDVVDRLLMLPAERDGDGSAAHLPADLATAVLEAMAPALGVTMVVTDLDGEPLTPLVNPAPAIRAQQRDPSFLVRCTSEWSRYAQTPHLAPRFETSRHGFLCAHGLVRCGPNLVAMVLAGGIALDGDHTGADAPPTDGLYHLDDAARRRVLDALPRTAAVLSRIASLGASRARQEVHA
jgi:excisionase family DNA binding protein